MIRKIEEDLRYQKKKKKKIGEKEKTQKKRRKKSMNLANITHITNREEDGRREQGATSLNYPKRGCPAELRYIL